MIDLRSFNVPTDGVSDCRPAIQAAINAAAPGDVVYFPAGQYPVSRAGTAYFCLEARDVKLVGPGELVQMPCAAGVQLLRLHGNVTVRDLELNGNAANQPNTDEHRHGLFLDGTTDASIERVSVVDFTGDGIYLRAAVNTSLYHVLSHGNLRNGLTLSGQVSGFRADLSVFNSNGAQQVDSEPGGTDVVSNVTLVDCELRSPHDYALTISGTSSTSPGRRWRVTGCSIDGGVNVVWAEDVRISRCNLGKLDIRRSSRGVRVSGCKTGKVLLEGTAGSGPSDVVIAGCEVDGGFEVRGAESARILGNEATGTGRGVYVRDTVSGRVAAVRVEDNVFRGFDTEVEYVGGGTGPQVARNLLEPA